MSFGKPFKGVRADRMASEDETGCRYVLVAGLIAGRGTTPAATPSPQVAAPGMLLSQCRGPPLSSRARGRRRDVRELSVPLFAPPSDDALRMK